MFQQVTIAGRLGQAPTLNHHNGEPVVNFSVAVNKPRKVGDEWQEIVTWFKCSWWPMGTAADPEQLRDRLSKMPGSRPVLVVGEVAPGLWTDKDRQPHAELRLRVDTFRLMPMGDPGGRLEAGSTNTARAANSQAATAFGDDPGDGTDDPEPEALPF